ncbi:MAG: DNA gyrase subunit A [Candidatus Woykebacteria bacterium RIFCSPHIGHO2_01_FULL_43_29]|uniref:DNA gyrase subunit A n=2 Tax=Candidatus Woykeibacteriota TaxID=1817899 RepID=A0A1G1WW99_9BACT|nr:MAG: DNA gyrase subunit A [Candidatus Woykebacteria bacterium RIFCSPHIGHO2_01_FULL_43_29]OGY28382.1 MAG: DNA gyrase subunit A [Candidatus Woykebacteria bacterium RIFCSPHIGHO2_02_FULL_43_16b]OGY31975.1 MAG: DNA gyrase subunit A [Candidatus Woykebacteria bacterium RIFCSPLOWO2_01_FULL_43_14]
MENNIGKLQPVEITEEMQRSYLNYAMSVIVARALPDVRDGLKPVHRRILFAMNELGLTFSAKYRKSATVVGEVLGKYHPHGDMPVYDAMVRLAQDFALRYPLVDGQGNFGSVDGDPPAAMRYTEARLDKISDEMLSDIDKETVAFIDNFDATRVEPTVLPSRLPNLLLNGGSGIAVGMATNIPPHNLRELCDALTLMLGKAKEVPENSQKPKESNPKDTLNLNIPFKKETQVSTIPQYDPYQVKIQGFSYDVTVEDLMKHIKGPDFPTGGAIFNKAEIMSAYATGKGRIVMRAKAEVEEEKNGRFNIVVSEIPYQVNKSTLVARIAELVKEKKLEGISDLRDESDRQGMRIVIELKRDARPQNLLNQLFKLTSMQLAFNVNTVALVDGTPQTLMLNTILEEYLKHRQLIIVRRSVHDLNSARLRSHILEGLKIALDNLDAVIETIRKSSDAEVAKQNLMVKFKLSDLQAQAILDMQLRRLAALERQKIEDEYKNVLKVIKGLVDLICSPRKVLTQIGNELSEVKAKYGDDRRTRVYDQAVGEFSEEDLIASENIIVTVTRAGYIKRSPLNTFRTQHRGGKGVSGMGMKEDDSIANIFSANTHDNILFFTNKGRVFQIKVYELPEGSRYSKGQALINLINLEQAEKINSILVTPKSQTSGYMFMATARGIVKKTAVEEFAHIRRNGMIAINLSSGDSLVWVKLTTGEDDILVVSKNGLSIKFHEKDVRPLGRATAGVLGIKLATSDEVVAMEVAGKETFLLTVMENGYGKKTPITDWPTQKRGGSGVKSAEVTSKTGKIISSKIVTPESVDVIITSDKGQVIKLPLDTVPKLKRQTQGVIMIRMSGSGDKVSAVAVLSKQEKEISLDSEDTA